MMRILTALAAISALAACAGLTAPSQAPMMHLLPDPPAPTAPVSQRGAGPIAVSTLSLPEYADVAGIATMEADGTVERSLDHLWADPPARAMTLAFARALGRRAGVVALAEPWPLEFAPARRVDVIVDRMIADRAGALRMSGEYRITDRAGLRRVAGFDLAATGEGEGFGAVADAHARALAALADVVAADLGN
jgi:uncharacterized lipoprotein YmbA